MTNPETNKEPSNKQPRNTNWYNLLNYIKNSFRPIDSLTKFTPLILIGVLIAALYGSRENILESLSDPAIARGLITLLFAVATVWIAMILALAAINDDKSDDKKFNRGKDILTILVGIFGTILGYYFGTQSGTQSQQGEQLQNQQNQQNPSAEVQRVPEEQQLPSGENQNNSQ